jgi:acetyl-CoA C-acetyltransferase
VDAFIVGWGHTPFGKLAGDDLESLIVKAAREAVAHARLGFEDLDAVFVGNFNAGMDPQGFPASLALQADPALRHKPVTRVENACASGSAAVHAGLMAIAAGRARRVLVVGAEKMTAAAGPAVNQALSTASYVKEEHSPGGFAAVFGGIAERYFGRHGDQSDALARIAARNHRNGAANPLAHLRKDFGYAFCREASSANPVVAPPLKRTDCSLVSDGAAALVLADRDLLPSAPRAIGFRAAVQVNDFLPMSRRDMTRLEGCAVAWTRALEGASVVLSDLSLVETHDCFTIAELMEYEAMGLTAPGEGFRAVEEGWTEPGGKLPTNLSGGLKSKGHPIGATGVSMHVLGAMQLTGTFPGVQHPDPKLAGIFNMGGAGVANYVSILERRR